MSECSVAWEEYEREFRKREEIEERKKTIKPSHHLPLKAISYRSLTVAYQAIVHRHLQKVKSLYSRTHLYINVSLLAMGTPHPPF